MKCKKYKPLPPQRLFHLLTESRRVLLLPKGCGKTKATAIESIYLSVGMSSASIETPILGLLFNNDGFLQKELEETITSNIMDKVDPFGVTEGVLNTIKFSNGSIIELGCEGKPNLYTRYNFVAFDMLPSKSLYELATKDLRSDGLVWLSIHPSDWANTPWLHKEFKIVNEA